MINNLVGKITSAASGRNVLIFLLSASIVYFSMLLYTIPNIEQHAAGLKLFDLSPLGYSHEYAMKLLTMLGDEGRHAYLYLQLPLDFIYPALFAISSSLLMAWLLTKGRVSSEKLFYFCLIPFLAGLFDYLENIQIILMIINFPDVSKYLVASASLATLGKSGLSTISFTVLIVAFIRTILIRRPGYIGLQKNR